MSTPSGYGLVLAVCGAALCFAGLCAVWGGTPGARHGPEIRQSRGRFRRRKMGLTLQQSQEQPRTGRTNSLSGRRIDEWTLEESAKAGIRT